MTCDPAHAPCKYVAVAALLLWPTEGVVVAAQLLRRLYQVYTMARPRYLWYPRP